MYVYLQLLVQLVEHFAAQISRVEVQLSTDRQRSYDWLTANERM